MITPHSALIQSWRILQKLVMKLLLVDNASADGSAERLEAEFPQVRLLRSQQNRGIAGGNNLGIKNGDSQYVLLLIMTRLFPLAASTSYDVFL